MTGALIGCGSGCAPFYSVCFYGYSGAYTHKQPYKDNNERAIDDLFKVCSSLGNIPCVISADINTTPEQSPTLKCSDSVDLRPPKDGLPLVDQRRGTHIA